MRNISVFKINFDMSLELSWCLDGKYLEEHHSATGGLELHTSCIQCSCLTY